MRWLAVLVVAGPVMAEPLVDLPALFKQHADKVVVKDNGTTVFHELSLGDGVVTRCKGDGFEDCVSVDANSKGGTTDCALVGAMRTLLMTRSCGIGSASQRFMLEKVIGELGEHVARNAVPPRDWMDLRVVVLDRAEVEPLPTCAQIDDVGRDFFARRLRLEELQALHALTGKPRLPAGKCLD